MKQEKVDWEKNHGKILHEYTLYDLIEKIPELNIENDQKEKFIISINFDRQNGKITAVYEDENGTQQKKVIQVPHINVNTLNDFEILQLLSENSDNTTILQKIILKKSGAQTKNFNINDTVKYYIDEYAREQENNFQSPINYLIKKHLLHLLENDSEIRTQIKEIVRN